MRNIRSSAPKRPVTWVINDVSVGTLAANSLGVTDLLSPGVVDPVITRDATVVRIRGVLGVMQTGIGTQVTWTAGLIVCNTDQVATAGAMPNPASEDADWIWHYGQRNFCQRDAGGGLNNINPVYVTIDNKSMRKMKENEKTLALCMFNHTLSDSSISYSLLLRILIKRA